MAIGEVRRSTEFQFVIRRGDDLVVTFDLNDNDGDPCGVVVLGDPVQAGQGTVSGHARVYGTDVALPVEATLGDVGSSTTPMRVRLRVSHGSIERVFDEGAQQSFVLQAIITRPQRRETIFEAEVEVEDSAFGSVSG